MPNRVFTKSLRILYPLVTSGHHLCLSGRGNTRPGFIRLALMPALAELKERQMPMNTKIQFKRSLAVLGAAAILASATALPVAAAQRVSAVRHLAHIGTPTFLLSRYGGNSGGRIAVGRISVFLAGPQPKSRCHESWCGCRRPGDGLSGEGRSICRGKGF